MLFLPALHRAKAWIPAVGTRAGGPRSSRVGRIARLPLERPIGHDAATVPVRHWPERTAGEPGRARSALQAALGATYGRAPEIEL